MELNDMKELASNGEEGIWVTWDDARFKIRSTSSKTYLRAIQKASKGKSNHKLTKDLEVAEKFGVEAMADGLLIDWENVTVDGKQIECTRENRIKVLEIAKPLREFLAGEAQDYTNFESEKEEDDSATFQSDSGVDE